MKSGRRIFNIFLFIILLIVISYLVFTGGQVTVFGTTVDGKVLLGGTDEIATLSSDKITTIRIVLDGNTGTLKYYDDSLNVAREIAFTPNVATGATSVSEYLKLLTDYVFHWYASSGATGALNVYEVRITDGNEYVKPDVSPIYYYTNGGVLGDDAPMEYDPTTKTMLPTDVARDGYVFGGWYTTEDFEEGTSTTYVPKGTEGAYKAYAKWLKTIVAKQWSADELNVTEATKWSDFGYRASGKSGASFVTKTDGNGVSYLEWIKGTADPDIMFTPKTNNLSTVTSSDKSVTFTVSLSLKEGYSSIKTVFNLLAKKDVNGSSVNGPNTVFGTTTDGKVLLGGTDEVETLSSDKITTIRIVLDGNTGTFKYYDNSLNVAKEIAFVPNSATGAANVSEYLKLLTDYVFLWYASSGATAAFNIYELRITDGNEYAKEEKSDVPAIFYNTNGALLPADAPAEYDSMVNTVLPTDITLDGYTFGGWYTTETFEEGTRTTYVPKGTEGAYKVYAKWLKAILAKQWSADELDVTEATKWADFGYRAAGKSGASFITKTDESGANYLEWIKGTADPDIMYTPKTNNLSTATSADKSVTFTLKLSLKEGYNSIKTVFNLMAKKDVNGNSVSCSNTLFGTTTDGKVLLGGTDEIATLSSDKITTIRIVLDGNDGTLKYYDDSLNVAKEIAFVPHTATGATNISDYLKLLTDYVFYWYASTGATGALNVYEINIADGNAYAK